MRIVDEHKEDGDKVHRPNALDPPDEVMLKRRILVKRFQEKRNRKDEKYRNAKISGRDDRSVQRNCVSNEDWNMIDEDP
jgi:hypothetical protein